MTEQRRFSGGLLLVVLLAASCFSGESSGLLGPFSGEGSGFSISVDSDLGERWGFRYPVTVVFAVAEATDVLAGPGQGPWRTLPRRYAGELYNGVEGVRFDPANDRAFVSVGFHEGSEIQVWFQDHEDVEFVRVATMYDGREVAYTLSNDNWGRSPRGNDGAEFQGMTTDASDKYQASIHAARSFGIPITIAVNSNRDPQTEAAKWRNMQDELDRGDRSWEPAVHTRSHPCSHSAYMEDGYAAEILGGRDDILDRLEGIPYGPHVLTFVLPCGHDDAQLEDVAAEEFLFLRDWDNGDHLDPSETSYAAWDAEHRFYGPGGFQTLSYDGVMEARNPSGRFYQDDLAELNEAFDEVRERGGIFYAMFHSDRYENSVIYDPREGIDGEQGSTLMKHLAYVSGRPDVWYVANGWLYSYHHAARHLVVEGLQ